MPRVAWDDEVDAILNGDLTAALGYRTPAGGAVVLAVAPIGLHDRGAGRVGFTTSLGFSKKLDRIADDPRVALAFHAREHGSASRPAYVLVQGRATVDAAPTPARKAQVFEHAERYLGAAPRGRFWDWWLKEYGDVRVPVDVEVERIVVWPDLRCAGEPVVHGAPLPGPPPPQPPPKNGTAPRINVTRAAGRLGQDPAHTRRLVRRRRLSGRAPRDDRTRRTRGPAPRPPRRRSRRAAAAPGLLGHTYRPKLVGLLTRQHTGWLDGGLYAPHTEVGYQAPPNKTMLLLLNGALAKQGVRKARKLGKL